MNKSKRSSNISNIKKRNAHYIFKYLLMINFLEYLEAGALPCMLLQISNSFYMTSGQAGLLGGIVYISLSVGGPFAGYLLRNYDHQLIVGLSLIINNIFTLTWALTPVNLTYSTISFISLRFLMGLTQCVVCIYMPLWANEFAPKDKKTSWMSYQQASVPLGVMSGYILASFISTFSSNTNVVLSLLSWRWPFIIEAFLLIPFCIGWFLIPKEHLNIRISNKLNDLNTNKTSSIEENGELTPLKNHKMNHYLAFDETIKSDMTIMNPIQYNNNVDKIIDKQFDRSPKHHSIIHYSINSSNNTTIDSTQSEFIDDNLITAKRIDSSAKVRFKSPTRTSSTPGNVPDISDGYVEMKSVMPTIEKNISTYSDENYNLSNANSSENLNEIYSDSEDSDNTDNYNNVPNSKHSNVHFHNYAKGISNPYLAERNNRRRLRRHSMTASLVDPLYARDVIKISNEDLATLETADNIITMYPGINWTRSDSIENDIKQSDLMSDNNKSNILNNLYSSFYKLLYKSSNTVKIPNNQISINVESIQISDDTADLKDKEIGSNRIRAYSSASDNDMNVIEIDRCESNEDISSSAGKSSPYEIKYIKRSDSKRLSKSNGLTYTSLKDISKNQSNPKIVDGQFINSIRKRLIGTKKNSSNNLLKDKTTILNSNSSYNYINTSDSINSMPSQSIDTGDNINENNVDNITTTREHKMINDITRTPNNTEITPNSVSTIGSSPSKNPSPQKKVMTDVSIDTADSKDHTISVNDESKENSNHSPTLISIDITDEPIEPTNDSLSRTNSLSSSDSGSDDYFDYTNHNISSSVSSPSHRLTSNNPNSNLPMYGSFKSLLASIRKLLNMPVYSNLLGAMTCLYFTVTGVQYWGTAYLSVGLNAPLPIVESLFILCTATGPTLGVFFGGWLIDILGGYKGLRQRVVALELCCFFGLIGCLCTIPVSLLSNIYAVSFFLWLVLFCGAAILPACSGMLVSIIPRRYRPLSASINLVVFNLFGYSASLLLSGYLMQILESLRIYNCDQICSLTWGFRLILMWCFISLTLLIKALLASYQSKEKKQAIVLQHSSIYTYVVGERNKRYNVYSSINI